MKALSTSRKAKLNIISSFISQTVVLICGLIIPHVLLGEYGSEVYGAVASIGSFLGYITLLEGGVAAIARAALYKALAQNDQMAISDCVQETKVFFRKIAIAFLVYVIFLACFYRQIAQSSTLDYWFSFFLVIVIAISTFAEYFIGISYSMLFQADQRAYIPTIIKIITTILNSCSVIFLVRCHCSMIVVKLAASLISLIRPICLYIIANKNYTLVPTNKKQKMLTQKSTAVGQHIAWVIHNNTDVAVLTVFGSLPLVSVYSVYHMIVSQVQNVVTSFTSGMEAVLGELYAKKEIVKLNSVFNYYEALISTVAVPFFSATMVLIVPFIKLYTVKLTDVNYIEPVFAIILVVAFLATTLRSPYGSMIIAAGEFKKTRIAAYGEAAINILVSVLLVFKYGLIGVAIGTVLATMFRWMFYAKFLSNHIMNRNIWLWIKRLLINSGIVIISIALGNMVISNASFSSYITWVWYAILVTIIVFAVSILANFIFYHSDMKVILIKIIRRK